MMLEPEHLHGVMVAMLTPVGDDGSVDRDTAARLSADLVERGVRGVCPAGTTGEGPSLPLGERIGLLDAVCSAVPAGTPVVPGVFQDAVDDARREIDAYAEHGASAVLVAPPHYYTLPRDDVQGFYEAVADASRLPIVVYNIPAFTKNAVPPRALAALAARPNVVGLKDSSRDVEYLLGVLDALREVEIGPERFAVATGTDTMLIASLTAGAHGAIVASANVAPELPCGVMQACRTGDLAGAVALEARLRRLVAACRVGGFPAGWKAGAAAVGACAPWMVPPRQSLDGPTRVALADELRSLEIVAPRL